MLRKEFFDFCTEEVPLEFLHPTSKYGLIYVILLLVDNTHWMLKVGKTESENGIFDRFTRHRRTYNVPDPDNYPTLIPLRIIKTRNAQLDEKKFKKMLKIDKVPNFSKPDSFHTEQTYNITDAYNAICDECDDCDLIEGEDYWDSAKCEIMDDNQIEFNGDMISQSEVEESETFESILTDETCDKIESICKTHSKSETSFNVKDRRWLFDILMRLYEIDTSNVVHTENTILNMKKIIKSNSTGYVKIEIRKKIFESVIDYINFVYQ